MTDLIRAGVLALAHDGFCTREAPHAGREFTRQCYGFQEDRFAVVVYGEDGTEQHFTIIREDRPNPRGSEAEVQP